MNPFFLKNGAAVFMMPYDNDGTNKKNKNTIINAGGALYNIAAEVVIDVNGKSSPNVIGRDIFKFYLGSNGILYPVGGKDYCNVIFNALKNGVESLSNDELRIFFDNEYKK